MRTNLKERILNWDEFIKEFEDKYFPSSYRDAKKKKLLRLVQGTMAVAEYENKFTELSKYAGTIVASEIDHCKRFEEGLRREIRTPTTANAEWTEYSKLVETALRVERSLT